MMSWPRAPRRRPSSTASCSSSPLHDGPIIGKVSFMQKTASPAAREILSRLHDVMASRTAPQAKLNRVVQIIAKALRSEVCSIYLLRDGSLELFATVGLKQEAVHVTRLALGQGLVGTIAEDVDVLNLAEARAHSDFEYRPETRERSEE